MAGQVVRAVGSASTAEYRVEGAGPCGVLPSKMLTLAVSLPDGVLVSRNTWEAETCKTEGWVLRPPWLAHFSHSPETSSLSVWIPFRDMICRKDQGSLS